MNEAVHWYLCLFVSVSLSFWIHLLSVWMLVFSLYLSIFLSQYLSTELMCDSVSASLSSCLYICLYISLSVCIFHCDCQFVLVFDYLPSSLFVCWSVFLYLTLFSFIILSVCVCLTMSVSYCVSFPLCLFYCQSSNAWFSFPRQDRDGRITQEEFHEGSKANPSVVQALSLYDGLVWPHFLKAHKFTQTCQITREWRHLNWDW